MGRELADLDEATSQARKPPTNGGPLPLHDRSPMEIGRITPPSYMCLRTTPCKQQGFGALRPSPKNSDLRGNRVPNHGNMHAQVEPRGPQLYRTINDSNGTHLVNKIWLKPEKGNLLRHRRWCQKATSTCKLEKAGPFGEKARLEKYLRGSSRKHSLPSRSSTISASTSKRGLKFDLEVKVSSKILWNSSPASPFLQTVGLFQLACGCSPHWTRKISSCTVLVCSIQV